MADRPLLREPDFLKLWIGQSVSQIGSHISREGLPLTAALVLAVSPFQMGVMNGLSGAAVLTFGLFAGAWVDRVRRRPVLIVTDLLRALLLASIPIAALLHRLTFAQLVVVTCAEGVLTTLFDVAYRTYLPSLVGPDAILEANSKLAITESTSEVVGPGLTGLLVQWLTAPIAILFDSISFVASMLSLAAIRTLEQKPERAAEEHIVREIGEGLAVCWRDRRLRALVLRTAIGAFSLGSFTLYVLYAIRDLHLNAAQLGLVIAVGGASNLLGAFVAPRIIQRLGIGPALIGAGLLLGFTSMVPALARGSVAACCAVLIAAQLGDIGWPIANICDRTICQTVAPPAVLGRVNAAMHLMFRGLLPAGALVGGAIASIVGMRTAIAVGGFGFLLAQLFLVFSPIRRMK